MPALIRTRTATMRYDLAHADQDGRLAIRKAALTLGWPADATLAATYRALCIVVAQDPAGSLKLGKGARLRLPIAPCADERG